MPKSDVAKEITDLIGISEVRFSTGSTEPKELWTGIVEALGLGVDTSLPKQKIARAIVESCGELWLPDYESTGGTVTFQGMVAVKRAVQFYLNNKT